MVGGEKLTRMTVLAMTTVGINCGHAVEEWVETLDASNILSAPAHVRDRLDRLGKESASAQNLRTPITTVEKVLRSLGDTIYALMARDRGVLGYVKVGRRHLFLCAPPLPSEDRDGAAIVELDPLCALDFIVSEQLRRTGRGEKIFSAMLAAEGMEDASCLAYDRPSGKMLQFLERHYGMRKMTVQPNRFAVHGDFWKVYGSGSL